MMGKSNRIFYKLEQFINLKKLYKYYMVGEKISYLYY